MPDTPTLIRRFSGGLCADCCSTDTSLMSSPIRCLPCSASSDSVCMWDNFIKSPLPILSKRALDSIKKDWYSIKKSSAFCPKALILSRESLLYQKEHYVLALPLVILCVCERVRGQGVCSERKSSHECGVCVREESQVMYPDAYVRVYTYWRWKKTHPHHTHIYICSHKHTHIHTHTYTCTHTHTHTHAHTYVCAFACICWHLYKNIVRIHTQTHTHTHMHR